MRINFPSGHYYAKEQAILGKILQWTENTDNVSDLADANSYWTYLNEELYKPVDSKNGIFSEEADVSESLSISKETLQAEQKRLRELSINDYNYVESLGLPMFYLPYDTLFNPTIYKGNTVGEHNIYKNHSYGHAFSLQSLKDNAEQIESYRNDTTLESIDKSTDISLALSTKQIRFYYNALTREVTSDTFLFYAVSEDEHGNPKLALLGINVAEITVY